MSRYRIIAIPDAITEAVRTTRVAPQYGHPAQTELAAGYGPCRQCLRYFKVGEERRILFTYDPFAGKEVPLPGPVFIHEASCARYPRDGGFPSELRAHPLTLDAYGRGRRLLAEEHVSGDEAEAVVERLLARAEVDYIHVRDTRAGCFDFAIERASSLAEHAYAGEQGC